MTISAYVVSASDLDDTRRLTYEFDPSGAPWFCTVPEDEWPFEHEEAVTEVKKDFEGPWGDRRQELVFIGERLDAEALTAELDRCLVTDEEWRRVEKVMKGKKGTWKEKSAKLMTIFMDGFEVSPIIVFGISAKDKL